MQKSSLRGSSEYNAVEILLKGKERRLPAGVLIKGGDGIARSHYRVRWWLNREEVSRADTLSQISLIPEAAASYEADEDWFNSEKQQLSFERDYPVTGKPLFFGHYWLTGRPALLKSNMACLDYAVANGGKIAAYQWSGEKELKNERFMWVASRI